MQVIAEASSRKNSQQLVSGVAVLLVFVGCAVAVLQTVLVQQLFVFAPDVPWLYGWMFFAAYGGALAGLTLTASQPLERWDRRMIVVIAVVSFCISALVELLLFSLAFSRLPDSPPITPLQALFYLSTLPIAVGPELAAWIGGKRLKKRAGDPQRSRLLAVTVPTLVILAVNVALVLFWRGHSPFING